MVDDLEKAEAKMLAEKTEIENSEQDSKPYEEIQWEDEYYAYLSNSENDEGRAVYFDKYQEAKNQLKEMRKGKEARSQTPPPTHTAKVTDPPTSLYPEAVAMQPNGQIDTNVKEVTIKTTPQKFPSSLYPNVVVISQLDGQAQGKDTVADLSPDEEKVRGIRPQIKILSQLDGPTDPSSDEEWMERENSPISKGKNKKKTKRRKFSKSPKSTERQDDISSSENGNGEIPSSDLEGMFSSSLDEENLVDISTRKKITQDSGRAKRRKTGKTHETTKTDREYQKIDKTAEKPRKRSNKERLNSYETYGSRYRLKKSERHATGPVVGPSFVSDRSSAQLVLGRWPLFPAAPCEYEPHRHPPASCRCLLDHSKSEDGRQRRRSPSSLAESNSAS
ncbi:hypothetical protein JTB14_010544 [Gonioctena quinquepunctata]|nr:hypothetical protein JTB14_010544 [Gonioctena quinquepunctata]